MKYNSDSILIYILVYCHKIVIIYCSRSQTSQFLLLHTGLYAAMIAGLGSSTVDQVLKYTKYPKYIPSTSTAWSSTHFFKKYLSTTSTFISSTSTSTSTHIKICSKVRMDIQSRVNFVWTK